MNPHLIILFVILPMAAGIVSVLLHSFKQAQRVVGLLFLLANAACAAWALATVVTAPDAVSRILTSQMGNWPAPFGITIVVDPLSAIMLTVSSVTCVAVFIYCSTQLPTRFAGGYFYALFHLLMMGVQWAFITGDLFNLFVAFEIMLMASYVLFVVGTTREQVRQAYKYILLNLLGSTLFVTALGWLYGQLGTLNMADMSRMAMMGTLPKSSIPVIALLLVVFGGKTAIFPLWFWLPDAYHTLPAGIVGLFAALLTKVGAYVLIRVFVMIFGPSQEVSQVLVPVLMISAGVTMFLGVLGAVSMHTVRRILSIHIISQVGYMVMGIGMGMTIGAATGSKELAVAGAIFFVIHNMAVKCCLFLCGGLMQTHAGSDDLDRIGGLLKKAPWLATLFMIAAMSLAGLPPLSGFFGKFVLIREAITQERWVVMTFAILTSLFTLLSMLKIWSYGFWSPAPEVSLEKADMRRAISEGLMHERPRIAGGMVAVVLLVGVSLSMGLGAQKYLDISTLAAQSLVNPEPYIEAVLGKERIREIEASRLQASRLTMDTEGVR
ncbi:MAG: Na+/H+ antiporter subunit D [Phycisphaera sp.]|nr:Na+/H+ antiporter subunit D [Phycisphaera sp.]